MRWSFREEKTCVREGLGRWCGEKAEEVPGAGRETCMYNRHVDEEEACDGLAMTKVS